MPQGSCSAKLESRFANHCETKKNYSKAIETPQQYTMLLSNVTTKGESPSMKNPLESLQSTVVMGVALTVIMVAVLAAIS